MNAAIIADIADTEIPPADLLITRALLNPPDRAPHLQAEVAAFCELSKILADDPCVALRRFAQAAELQLTQALKLLEQARKHRHALALLDSHKMAQRALTHALAQPRRREPAAESSSGVRPASAFADISIGEVHHRVKSTIQMAASLLWLHARATPCAQVRSTLRTSYGRLRLLDRMHELLYASAGSTQEILMPTLLQSMSDALRQSFAEMSHRVRLQIMSDPVVLPADDAIPVALLANEAITNAYKHAFPGDAGGDIVVNLQCTPESAVILQITDNGIGALPSSSDCGLGLRLCRGLATQLHGTLAFAKPADAAGMAVTLMIDRAARHGASVLSVR